MAGITKTIGTTKVVVTTKEEEVVTTEVGAVGLDLTVLTDHSI